MGSLVEWRSKNGNARYQTIYRHGCCNGLAVYVSGLAMVRSVQLTRSGHYQMGTTNQYARDYCVRKIEECKDYSLDLFERRKPQLGLQNSSSPLQAMGSGRYQNRLYGQRRSGNGELVSRHYQMCRPQSIAG